MPRTPLEAYAFDARFGKRSVFILDPRLVFSLKAIPTQKIVRCLLSPLCGTSRGRKLGGHLFFSYHEIVLSAMVDKLCFTCFFPLAINFHRSRLLLSH